VGERVANAGREAADDLLVGAAVGLVVDSVGTDLAIIAKTRGVEVAEQARGSRASRPSK